MWWYGKLSDPGITSSNNKVRLVVIFWSDFLSRLFCAFLSSNNFCCCRGCFIIYWIRMIALNALLLNWSLSCCHAYPVFFFYHSISSVLCLLSICSCKSLQIVGSNFLNTCCNTIHFTGTCSNWLDDMYAWMMI